MIYNFHHSDLHRILHTTDAPHKRIKNTCICWYGDVTFCEEMFSFFERGLQCQHFSNRINVTRERRREAGTGMTVYSCYKVSGNRN